MKQEKALKNYYVGLDIGTDSVGYAVTSPSYQLLKCKGEPMWGTTIFDKAQLSQDRRTHRTERRRLNRKKQRITLLKELFASEISSIDTSFFIRLSESYLYRENSEEVFSLFPTMKEQKDYINKYPTVHHLIVDLMNSTENHDIRLVYLACLWLVAHRGHFLSEVNKENVDQVLDFKVVYCNLVCFLRQDGFALPWSEELNEDEIGNILRKPLGITKKLKELSIFLYGKNTVSKAVDEEHQFSTDGILRLLCGGKTSLKDLFGNNEYEEIGSVSLDMDDEALGQIFSQIGDDADLLIHLKAVYDWSVLVEVLHGEKTISQAKVDIYHQHQDDLKFLKYFIRTYASDKFSDVFRASSKKTNYAFYAMHMNPNEKKAMSEVCKGKIPKASKEDFSKFLLSIVKNIKPKEEDKKAFDDMIARLELCKFLPKQKESDNRVIPYQLYWSELDKILKNAETYLPFLGEKDADGLTVSDKIRSIFEFRIPYYVGPLCSYKNENAWMVRKSEGKIFPWNFDKRVDRDASEQSFISRMTNQCTYLPDCDVLPQNSICYSALSVLNEINNLKINGINISVQAKQGIYLNLFMQSGKVSVKRIKDYLISCGYMGKDDVLSGIDETVKSSMKPYLQFKRSIDKGVLQIRDAEAIICRATYSEDRFRFETWVEREYPTLHSADRKYISNLKFKKFGRLSKKFLCGFLGVDKENGTGEAKSIMELLWETNCNLMQILSNRFTFAEQIDAYNKEYYSSHPSSLNERLDSMYISGSVKRPIIRTLDIMKDIVKVNQCAPQKIFVEMARGTNEDQKGKRSRTRYQQLKALYESIDSNEIRMMNEQLEKLGDHVDNVLQSDKVFLYFTQLGKCLYTGASISLDSLRHGDGTYNIEHIYPQSQVKDDSIINNEILVDSKANGEKKDVYPISTDIQEKMYGYWDYLHKCRLISDEKFKRLTRKTHFTDEEKLGFINRQLVETRQSTKAVATLLKELYPETEIVYVKAGLVSEFRHEFEILKSREVNDMHHAKDAYLNIVAGNVYNSRFSKQFFRVNEEYSIKTKTLFTHPVRLGNQIVWEGKSSLVAVKKVMEKTSVHFTKYSFCRTGALFDLMPLGAAENLIPRKKNMPTELYGGYNKPTASFFALVKYKTDKKTDIMVMPVDLMQSQKFLTDEKFANDYAKKTIENIVKKEIISIEILLNRRIIKVNTMLSLDGFKVCISGKSSGGAVIGLTPMMVFTCGLEREIYIKKMESFAKKKQKNSLIVADSAFDGITKEDNLELYDYYINKFSVWPYSKRPNNPIETLKKGRDKFENLETSAQVLVLLGIQGLFGRGIKADLKLIGGSASAGVAALSSMISNWKKNYKDVRIVDCSASGLFETVSDNLLDLL